MAASALFERCTFFEVIECGDAHALADKDDQSHRLRFTEASMRRTTLQRYLTSTPPMVRWVADMVRSVGFDLGDVCKAEVIEVRYGEGYELA